MHLLFHGFYGSAIWVLCSGSQNNVIKMLAKLFSFVGLRDFLEAHELLAESGSMLLLRLMSSFLASSQLLETTAVSCHMAPSQDCLQYGSRPLHGQEENVF